MKPHVFRENRLNHYDFVPRKGNVKILNILDRCYKNVIHSKRNADIVNTPDHWR